jgi:phosphonate transport system permease protein
MMLRSTPGPTTYGRFRRRRHRRRVVGLLALLVCAGVCGRLCKVDLAVLRRGFADSNGFVGLLFPPDWPATGRLLEPALQTVLIAGLATVLGGLLSLGFGLAGAANLTPGWLRQSARLLMGLERSVPEIVIMLLLISAIGLGPFPGVLALSIGCVGMLGRLFADTFEEISPATLDALRATGARPWQVILYGVLPQTLPALLANLLFRFEVNIRLSVLLGAVGAGGIGYQLYYSFQTLQYQRASLAMLLILSLVFGAERLSDRLRSRVAPAGKL